ncbi:MAG: glycosyltransferase family 39 protein, partial [Gemmatimonadota bacterium]|nr:glycosyltransferase family 39 protein [Gemmatimonadota bacterium]
MVNFKGLSERIRGQPYATLSLCVFGVAAYLCLVNLDYASLWHDEGVVSFIGKNLLEQGDIIGWDGRNLVGGTNGNALNEDLRDVAPPVQYFLTAMGFAIFGVNEIGARVLHALAGVFALGFFYLILRQQLSDNPRLVFFIFLFSAWSAQLLLYFRQARYYGIVVLCLMAGFYFYERYWQTKKPVCLAAVTLISALAFFSHYAGGTAMMLSLAAYHLIFRWRETAKREWVAFGCCGIAVGALGSAYLMFIGLIGGGRNPMASFLTADFGAYQGAVPLFLLKVWICVRDLFAADWISWSVLLWFACMVFLVYRKSVMRSRRRSGRRKRTEAHGEDLPVTAVGKIVLLGALFALFAALLTQQPVWLREVVLDFRYYVAALPLLLAMKGLFAEWVWRKSRIASGAVIAVLLFTSAGAAPFNITMTFTGERTLGVHFFSFIREIHRPYPDAIQGASGYLLQHAEQDDYVYVPSFDDREVLTFYTGHRVLFCGVLKEDSSLPRVRVEALRQSLYTGQCSPDWIAVFGPLS